MSPEEQDDLRHILNDVFNDGAFMRPGFTPSALTLSMTDTMLLEISACNKKVEKLLQALPCALIRRGFLRRCLKAVKKVVKDNRWEFRGCKNVAHSHWKKAIYLSGV